MGSSSPPSPPINLEHGHALAQPFTLYKPRLPSLALPPTSPAPFPSLGTFPSAEQKLPGTAEHLPRPPVSGPLLLLLPLPRMPSPSSLSDTYIQTLPTSKTHPLFQGGFQDALDISAPALTP